MRNIPNMAVPRISPAMFAPTKRPQAEDRERHQGILRASLPAEEAAEQDCGSGEEADRLD